MKLLHLTAKDILLWVTAALATFHAVHTTSNSSQPGMRREISMHSRVYFSPYARYQISKVIWIM